MKKWCEISIYTACVVFLLAVVVATVFVAGVLILSDIPWSAWSKMVTG